MRDFYSAPPRSDKSRRNATWCGAVWGAGLGIAATLSLSLLSSSVYTTYFAFFFVGPLLVLLGLAGGALLGRLVARSRDLDVSRGSIVLAAIGAFALTTVPFVVQTVQLYEIEYAELPTYPDAERLETTIDRGPDAKIMVRMRTTASKQEVAAYYDELWRQHGWSTNLDSEFVLLATKKGQTLLLTLHEPSGEIQATWYRSYSNH